MIGLSHTKNLKAAMYWVQRKMHEGGQFDLSGLIAPTDNLLYCKMAASKGREICKQIWYWSILIIGSRKSKMTWIADSVGPGSLYVTFFVHKCTGWIHAFIYCGQCHFEEPHFIDHFRATYFLCNNLVIKINAAMWFDKVQHGNGWAALFSV